MEKDSGDCVEQGKVHIDILYFEKATKFCEISTVDLSYTQSGLIRNPAKSH